MSEHENRQVVERYCQALAARDLKAAHALLHEDHVMEWPQSGERIRGRANAMAIDNHYPGFPDFRLRKIMGRGDLWVVEAVLVYSGKPTHAVAILEVKDGKIIKTTDYWGDPFEAPAWRAQWVERM